MVTGDDAWSAFLRRVTAPGTGWSVAKLAREAGLHRSAIFGWIREGSDGLTIRSVFAIADALGISRMEALRAAGNERDPEVDLIMASDRSDATKIAMIERLTLRREEDLRRRIEDLEYLLGGESEQRAG